MSKRRETRMGLEQLRELVTELAECLWPGGDTDHQWGPDTLDEIASLMESHGLGPDRPPEPGPDQAAEVGESSRRGMRGGAAPFLPGLGEGRVVSLDDTLSDYCREEGGEGEREEALAGWAADLDAAGASYRIESSISGVEVSWEMTLRQALWLGLNRGWFGNHDYGLDATGLAGLLAAGGEVWDGLAAEIIALWEAYRADPAHRE